MKKTLIFCLIWYVALMAVFIGCKSSDGFKSSTAKIQYKGNPTTGYNWIVDVSDESVISVSVKEKYLGSADVVGAPSMFYYTISSLSPGNSVLKFEYKRAWETKPAEETHIFDITVLSNGDIKMIER
ncbi:protease inhibitor I42 family protein [Treponema sp.]|uniref:protease inhibitor I42 family protein n=1 Tax=Treponema sp. TaxID=166 RepID=UPI00298DD762|nr:protease inhibitor I42 family protein [Treponema sp.]MCR5613550.1 protease inhibitor I42 family protein [Treponema sp.]